MKRSALTAALLVTASLGCDSTPATPDAALDTGSDIATVPDVPVVDATDVVDVVIDRASSGRACVFNRDCPDDERCVCDERAGCACLLGPRGTGRAGETVCTSGNECASALCVEANGGVSRCSDACDAPGGCPAALPRCVAVPTLGRICARDPSAPVPDAGVGPECAGACGTTTLAGTFGARMGAFSRAQHGLAGTDRVHIEAYFGGDPACPMMGSPTPDRTLVLTGVRGDADAGVQTEADGVAASLLDFGGALTELPVARATSVRITPRSIVRGRYVSLLVEATFAGGVIRGGLYAPHCTSLNGR
jgi:hypothetical protein